MSHSTDEVLEQVRKASGGESRLGLHGYPLNTAFDRGVLTLEGEVKGIAVKKLVLERAAAIPDVAGIIDRPHVAPAQSMGDGEISDAVRLVLEKGPFVDATRMRVSTRDYVVTLEGLVPTEAEREMAELDAWYILEIDKVVNRIEVQP